MFDTPLRYWRTIRHLKMRQLVWRVRLRLTSARIDAAQPAPPLRKPAGAWQPGPARAASLIGPATFRFLNQAHALPPVGGWDDPALEKLWRYNLHYFDDLAGLRPELITRWIAENPIGQGTGWEPYPLSLRLVNWSKWLAAGNAPPAGMLEAMAHQARWLEQRLEWHLLGNHLFANAKALAFAGTLFDGPEAERWRATAQAIIRDELPEQILPDGGNFERSPMYHAIFLEDVLDLANLAGRAPGLVSAEDLAIYREVAGRMIPWLRGMTHPDGGIALFNDAAIGIAPSLAELEGYAARLGILATAGEEGDTLSAITWLDSGYVRLGYGREAVALLDVAPVGPDYLPGHAHADTLSFELSVGGSRFIVNGGTSRYGLGPERERERGTAAHSTVEVGGQNSSEVWAGFRVARRAMPFDLEMETRTDAVSVACSHDGYARLPGRPIHRRRWDFSHGRLAVIDRVAPGAQDAIARFILHPGIAVSPAGEGGFACRAPDGTMVRIVARRGVARLEPAAYAPEFGLSMPTQALAVHLSEGGSDVEIQWGTSTDVGK